LVHFDEDERVLERVAAALGEVDDTVEVFSTTDANVALDRVASDPVDCVVTEFEESLLRTLRTDHPDVPCVLFTDAESVPVDAVTANVAAVVPKAAGRDEDHDETGDGAGSADGDGEGDAADRFAELAARTVDAVERRRDAADGERLATLVGESTDVVAVVGTDGRIEYVSPAAERILGYEPADLLGEPSLAYVHPDDRERAVERFRRLLDDPDGELSEDLRLRHADGSWVWVENRGRNLLHDPTVEGIVTYSRDITARKRREERLRRYEAIVENMDEVAYTVDDSLTVTYVNARALAYTDLSREGIVGQSIETLCERMLVDPDDVDRLRGVLEAVVAGESGGDRLELDVETPAGRVLAELQVTPLRTADATGGEPPRGAVVVSRDVTERATQKRELERQNERLEAFTSIVSHDLRSPLAVAQGNLELARTTGDGDRLDRVERAHERMGDLIESLLTIARQGTPVDAPEPVDLDAVAAESWRFVDSADATVEVDTGLVVRAEEQRLRQLFENLFRNAVEHGSTSSRPEPGDVTERRSVSSQDPERSDDAVEHGSTDSPTEASDAAEGADAEGNGGTDSDEAPVEDFVRGGSAPTDTGGDGHVDATASSDADDGVTVRVGALDDDAGFYVEDDGRGIPPEDRDAVFQAGYTTTPGGTGFGLMIVREIVDAHGWEVRVTDGPMGGARFEVRGVEIEPDGADGSDGPDGADGSDESTASDGSEG
jgi:PAS domain S-box-containing protein